MSINDAAIVGYAETKIERNSGRDIWDFGGEVLSSLLASTGIEKDEIDGMLVNGSMTGAGNAFWSQTTADYLGLELRFCQTVDRGGSSAVAAVARAAAALEAGLCSTILLLNADTQSTENNLRMRSYHGEFVDPFGSIGPATDFGLLSTRYDHLYGLDHRALGKIAVTLREHALLNELGSDKLRKPLDIEAYLNSPMVADPVRMLDCVMVCDGANGLLMTTRKRAKEKKFDKFVVPMGYGERSNYRASENIVDITESGHLVAGQHAFAQAGIGLADIGSAHLYDDFIIAVMLQLEMFGFAKRGQGCAFVQDTNLRFDGDLPINTSGGQMSAGQAGLAGGGTLLVEAIRQLFGEGGGRQVRNNGHALVSGIGWIPYGRHWGTTTALILGSEG